MMEEGGGHDHGSENMPDMGSGTMPDMGSGNMPGQGDMEAFKAFFAQRKVVFLEYSFDISGVNAEENSGNFMVYDPTVNREAGGSSGGGSGDGSSGGSGNCVRIPKSMADRLKAMPCSGGGGDSE